MSSFSEILFHPVVFSLFLAIFLTFFFKQFSKPNGKNNQPPSPKRLPIIGNLHQVGFYPHQSLRSMAQKYGPVMLLHFGTAPVIIISTAEAAGLIMKTYDQIFSDRPYSSVSARLVYNLKGVAMAPYGEQWRILKTIFVHQLLSNKKVRDFCWIREEEIGLMMEKIKGFSHSYTPVNLTELIMTTAKDIICRAAFGRKYGEGKEGDRFRYLFTEFDKLLLTESIGALIPWLRWIDRVNGFDKRVEELAKEIDEFLDSMVQERLEKGHDDDGSSTESGEDFLDILLRIHMDNSRDVSIDRDSVKASILDVFAAGINTTTALAEWLMSEAIKHPEILKKLQNEVRGILCGRQEITENDLEKMIYLKAVIKETLRLHPPSPLLVPRAARQDVEIMGYHVSSGTMVMINGWAISRDPNLWEKPEEFWPERFLNSDIDFKGKSNFQFTPFGGGRRGCPGILFALATNELMLANLLHKFDWKLPNGAKGEDLDMTEPLKFSSGRKIPLLALANPVSFS